MLHSRSPLRTLVLLLSGFLTSIASEIIFTNPPSNRDNAFYEGDLLDISWTGKYQPNYGLILVQHQGNDHNVSYYITVKNGSYGATGNSFVWSINIEAYNEKDKYKYDEGDNATFSIQMLPSTEDYTVLGQTSEFAIRKPANGQRPALWYAQQRIDLNGGGQNDVCDTLTANAKAGVGVGVAIGVILIAINTAWFILSMKRKDRAQASVEAAQSQQPQQQQIIPPPAPDSQFFSHLSMPPPPPFFPGTSLAPAPYEPQNNYSFANNTSAISSGRRPSDADSKREPGELPGNDTEHDPIFGSGESRRSSSRERQ